jgi:hypothetical protein
MVKESTENIKNEVESVVNEAVNRIYKQGGEFRKVYVMQNIR